MRKYVYVNIYVQIYMCKYVGMGAWQAVHESRADLKVVDTKAVESFNRNKVYTSIYIYIYTYCCTFVYFEYGEYIVIVLYTYI